jgi:hypothetical protein
MAGFPAIAFLPYIPNGRKTGHNSYVARIMLRKTFLNVTFRSGTILSTTPAYTNRITTNIVKTCLNLNNV